jgi:hypothetical protein
MHQDVEKLLNAAKEKGYITERQREIIISKAQQLGEDMSEVEFLLDDIPIKQQESLSSSVNNDPRPSSNKQGSVRKCPVCGAIVQSYMVSCPECKYVFENVSANSSMERLLELLQVVDNTTNDSSVFDDNVFRKKKSIIQNFPVPNTKTDIIDFIIALQPKALNINDRLAKSYFVKYEECINKAKLLFPDDKEIALLLLEYEKVRRKAKFSSEGKYSGATRFAVKGCLWYLIITIAFTIICFILAAIAGEF